MTCSQGSQAKLLVETSTSFTSGSERYDFLYETMQKHGRLLDVKGIVGSRSQPIERTKLGSYPVGGRLAMDTCPLDLDKWLPRVLGAAESSNVFAVAEDLPTFFMLIHKVGGVFRYDTCYVDRAIFRAIAGPQEEEKVELILDIMAKDENDGQSWPGTEPTLAVTANRAPYILAEGVLTIDGTAYPIKDFILAIDNFLEPRWVNSVTATEICPADRLVRLRTNNPFTATEFTGLYDLSAAATGVAASLVFTMGVYSTTFTFAGLQWADTSPVVQGKQEIPLTLDFYARMSGASREIVVTNIS